MSGRRHVVKLIGLVSAAKPYRLQEFGRRQRLVAVCHDDLVAAGEDLFASTNRVAGAEELRLVDEGYAGTFQRLFDQLPLMGQPRRRSFRDQGRWRRRWTCAAIGLPETLVEHFGQGRLHAGALARGEHNDAQLGRSWETRQTSCAVRGRLDGYGAVCRGTFRRVLFLAHKRGWRPRFHARYARKTMSSSHGRLDTPRPSLVAFLCDYATPSPNIRPRYVKRS